MEKFSKDPFFRCWAEFYCMFIVNFRFWGLQGLYRFILWDRMNTLKSKEIGRLHSIIFILFDIFSNCYKLILTSLGVVVLEKISWESPLEPDPGHTGAGKRHFLILQFFQSVPFSFNFIPLKKIFSNHRNFWFIVEYK